jgi:hypothetical protein
MYPIIESLEARILLSGEPHLSGHIVPPGGEYQVVEGRTIFVQGPQVQIIGCDDGDTLTISQTSGKNPKLIINSQDLGQFVYNGTFKAFSLTIEGENNSVEITWSVMMDSFLDIGDGSKSIYDYGLGKCTFTEGMGSTVYTKYVSTYGHMNWAYEDLHSWLNNGYYITGVTFPVFLNDLVPVFKGHEYEIKSVETTGLIVTDGTYLPTLLSYEQYVTIQDTAYPYESTMITVNQFFQVFQTLTVTMGSVDSGGSAPVSTQSPVVHKKVQLSDLRIVGDLPLPKLQPTLHVTLGESLLNIL